jgi:FG-GAP repeat
MAQLTSNTTGLTGTGAYIWHSTGRNGTGPVNGQWRVAYHGSAYTPWLSTSVTESDLETELELLDSIRDCTVTRENGAGASQYTWRVTFLAVNAPSRYGFVPVPMSNLPALTVDSSRIRGTGGSVAVSHCSGSGADDYAPWEGKQLGSFGAKAGAVFAYSRVEAVPGSGASSWELTGHLVGSDTNEADAFGTSVSGSGTEELIVVGAPYSEDLGVQAQQRLICSGGAATGTFTLSFRGFTTGPIPHDVTLSELRRAIIGPFGTTKNLHTLPNIEVAYADPVAEWGLGGTFCSGSATLNTAVLTFLTPAHGMYSYEGALELLTVDNSGLSGAAVSTTQLKTGTVNPSGPNSRGKLSLLLVLLVLLLLKHCCCLLIV